MRIIMNWKNEHVVNCPRCKNTIGFFDDDVNHVQDNSGKLIDSQIICPGCGLVISVRDLISK